MKAHEFARHAGKIEHRHAQSTKRMSEALARLIAQAGAAYIVNNNKITGYRMKDGSRVCTKRRFRTLAGADAELERIRMVNRSKYVPARAYACECKGFHLTSRE